MPNIAIIGAGISGLSTAYYLEKAGFNNITIFEQSNFIGGVLKTDVLNENIIEQAAESVAKFPQTVFELIDAIGLTNELIEPKVSKFQLYVKGNLTAPPTGLRYMVPTNLEAFKQSNFFSAEGKQRILQEVDIKENRLSEDLALKSFVVRRFGLEMYQRYAAPVYGGIFGYDADQLSLKTVLPQLLIWEKQYGSITKAVENLPKKSNRGAVYFSFKNGVHSLADGICKQLNKHNLYLNTTIKSIIKKNKKWWVNNLPFDKVILSCNATISAKLLKKEQIQLSELLKNIQFKSAGILTFLYDAELEEIDKFTSGILLPVDEFPEFSAITFSSNKWNNRTKPGNQLLRLYVREEHLINQTKNIVEQKGIALLQHVFKTTTKPVTTFLHRWPNSRPLYTMQHQHTVNQINDTLQQTPNLYLCGCSYNGSGIASLVHQSKLLAEKIGANYN